MGVPSWETASFTRCFRTCKVGWAATLTQGARAPDLDYAAPRLVIQIGSVLGGEYKLVRLLGDGGMGSVYEAVHDRLGTRAAVKTLHPDIARRPGIVDRFLQEAKVAAQIKSPHIAVVSDVDTTPDGLAYMVIELLEGEPLASLVEREKK